MEEKLGIECKMIVGALLKLLKIRSWYIQKREKSKHNVHISSAINSMHKYIAKSKLKCNLPIGLFKYEWIEMVS